MDDRPTLPFGEDARVPSLDLVLYPHRSLSPIGFWILMGLVAVVSFGAGFGFYAAGAWPVVGFLGLDVVLIYVAFRMSYRSGRVVETIRMRSSDLVVRRTSARGKVRTWSFQPDWLRGCSGPEAAQASWLATRRPSDGIGAGRAGARWL